MNLFYQYIFLQTTLDNISKKNTKKIESQFMELYLHSLTPATKFLPAASSSHYAPG